MMCNSLKFVYHSFVNTDVLIRLFFLLNHIYIYTFLSMCLLFERWICLNYTSSINFVYPSTNKWEINCTNKSQLSADYLNISQAVWMLATLSVHLCDLPSWCFVIFCYFNCLQSHIKLFWTSTSTFEANFGIFTLVVVCSNLNVCQN